MFTRKRIIGTLSERNDDISKSLEKSLILENGVPCFIKSLPTDNQDLTELSSLLLSCLKVNPAERISASEGLNHPFFNSLKNYIEMIRSKNPPKKNKIHNTFKFSSRKERLLMAEYFSSFINDYHNAYWYKPRRFFLAIDIFDRFLLFCEKNNHPEIPNDLVKFYSLLCLYTSIVYFSCTENIPAFKDIAPQSFLTDDYMTKGLEFQQLLLKNFNYKIYRKTVYETADDCKIDLTSADISKLLSIILFKPEKFLNKSFYEIIQTFKTS
jgi:serine/threonine protein kinase